MLNTLRPLIISMNNTSLSVAPVCPTVHSGMNQYTNYLVIPAQSWYWLDRVTGRIISNTNVKTLQTLSSLNELN